MKNTKAGRLPVARPEDPLKYRCTAQGPGLCRNRRHQNYQNYNDIAANQPTASQLRANCELTALLVIPTHHLGSDRFGRHAGGVEIPRIVGRAQRRRLAGSVARIALGDVV